MLPERILEPLHTHLLRVREQHRRDLKAGAGAVTLPGAIGRKYKNAGREWCWQWVFPARRFYRDDETGEAWSPTPGPMPRTPASGRFVIRHSAGLSQFARVTSGIRQELDVFAEAEDPVKFSLLTLTNESGAPRRLSVFAYNEWTLGRPRAGENLHVITELDPTTGRIHDTCEARTCRQP